MINILAGIFCLAVGLMPPNTDILSYICDVFGLISIVYGIVMKNRKEGM